MALGYTGRIMGLLVEAVRHHCQKPPFSVNDTNFEAEVLGSALPVLLDVWGPSCGPCKQLEPVIMDLCAFSTSMGAREGVRAERPGLTARDRAAQGLGQPTVLYFLRGEELERIHGFRSSLFHKQTIQDHFWHRAYHRSAVGGAKKMAGGGAGDMAGLLYLSGFVEPVGLSRGLLLAAGFLRL